MMAMATAPAVSADTPMGSKTRASRRLKLVKASRTTYSAAVTDGARNTTNAKAARLNVINT